MANVSLYIAATPWNFLNSFVFAEHRKDEKSYLMYVDFPIGQDNPYLEALQKIGADSPFIESWCFHGKFKGAIAKWQKRRQELEEIKCIVAELKPDQVFVGSDRRIEFQCAMTEAVKHKPQVKGIYLDEGVFSYTGRKRSQTWRDRVLDSWIKKLMYPCDWKHPITIGASDWINEGWLLRPEMAYSALATKISLKQIPLTFYRVEKLKLLLQSLIRFHESNTFSADALLILPHPSQLNESLKREINQRIRDNRVVSILVKPHPRMDSSLDWLMSSNTILLPKSIPLELLLFELDVRYVIATQSTALFTSALLRRDLQFIFYGKLEDAFEKLFFKIVEESKC
ncbi:hypothetical protein THMIRHAS_19930 [Thiosulfatimonas sediminis]|uniref:Glycosyl transferase n=1 Tax=Thiosulfatimonas sediminis TaxID=2675054 RepID=A0A6F8PXC5_9GAMM|nr:polysialyltransferase family glycosyltransferase [Thiosulfatimonas sediminis]BBP46620.1 hypothetical protein THMIRHAS_19930 [Thiosulfatimonas sediminis]